MSVGMMKVAPPVGSSLVLPGSEVAGSPDGPPLVGLVGSPVLAPTLVAPSVSLVLGLVAVGLTPVSLPLPLSPQPARVKAVQKRLEISRFLVMVSLVVCGLVN
ncbi:hypothetical protein [Nannocystis sp.]|uniref:hypothetical protein n=1 Tax=Nannocystis sp. TaxID=1962667 RepID=UPI0025E58B92|nr:hypothetical protein [Nannocystis sp.]MBK7824283.1 hypothetical protein [Nannocystis sp.]